MQRVGYTILVVGMVWMVGGPALAESDHHWAKETEGLVGELGHAAVALERAAAREHVLKAGPGAASGWVGDALADFEHALQRMTESGHKAASAAKRARAKLGKDIAADTAEALHRVDDAVARVEAFEKELRAQGKLLNDTHRQLKLDTPDHQVEVPETLDAVFRDLEKKFPHWKGDVKHIESHFGDRIRIGTTGCEKPTEETCPQRFELTLDDAVERVTKHGEMMEKLRTSYGKEIVEAVGAFIAARPNGLMADVATIAAVQRVRATSLHQQLDAATSGLVAIEGGGS